ncbi:vegetative cell wall protein gp1 [Phalaenopsis equestris]|uniref:vegetative cell wall protein gp1 n=1 Tax=Phalaenopsis equestris TaxID=78828 RepID=UPI0009E5C06E|nr:vegetative cell wall protein gp1 [Phalaenopsis equestris]
MAATPARELTTPPPAPVIGKAGRYTVFITPPVTPTPPPVKPPSQSPLTPNPNPNPSPSPSPVNAAPLLGKYSPPEGSPPQFEKTAAKGASSVFGLFWDAVAKVQNAHSSLDEYLADWLGLNQSKYQWALNDYYENNGSRKDCSKLKEQVSKDQTV